MKLFGKSVQNESFVNNIHTLIGIFDIYDFVFIITLIEKRCALVIR